jgi:hypothetical protein
MASMDHYDLRNREEQAPSASSSDHGRHAPPAGAGAGGKRGRENDDEDNNNNKNDTVTNVADQVRALLMSRFSAYGVPANVLQHIMSEDVFKAMTFCRSFTQVAARHTSTKGMMTGNTLLADLVRKMVSSAGGRYGAIAIDGASTSLLGGK